MFTRGFQGFDHSQVLGASEGWLTGWLLGVSILLGDEIVDWQGSGASSHFLDTKSLFSSPELAPLFLFAFLVPLLSTNQAKKPFFLLGS